MKRPFPLLFLLLTVVGIALAACGGEEPTPEPTETAVLPTTLPTNPPTTVPLPTETAVFSFTPEPTGDAPVEGRINYNETVDGQVKSNGRSQWTFKAKDGDYIYITVTPADGFDAVLDILNQEGESILPLGAIDDSFGEETADIGIPADGQYSIVVTGYADSSGDFQLLLSTAVETAVSSEYTSNNDGTISQWASYATASSEFSTDSWSAFQAEGAPDTFECGDNVTAWAAAKSSTIEWIELYYNTPVEVSEINIYQSFNPDQVVAVELLATDGEPVTIFQQEQVAQEACPYVLSLAVESNFASDGVRITIDQSALADWTEIDAVELIGVPVDGAVGRYTPASGSDEGVLWRIGGTSDYDDESIGHLDGVAYDAERRLIYAVSSFNGILVMNENGEQVDLFATDSVFFSPTAIDLDAAGNIYVANNSFDDEDERVIVFSPDGDVIAEYGKAGTGDGEFGILSPSSLAVAADGTTYVFDSNDDENGESIYRIQKFSPDGTFQAIIPIDPDYILSYDAPMAVDGEGFVYLAEWLNGTIIKMDSAGNMVKKIRRGDDFYYSSVQAIDVDAAGNLYVSLWDEPSILKLDQDGNVLMSFGSEVETGDMAWPAGSFYWPNGVAVTPDGRTLYVTDWSGDYSYLTAVDMRE